MTAEVIYEHGVLNRDFKSLLVARDLYPYLKYIAQGPARAGSIPDLIRAVREDPRAYDLAAALHQLQPRRH